MFYGTGYNSKEALFKGGFWYVSEDARYPLGDYTERVLDWDHLQSDPPVFTSCTLRRGKKHPHAAMLREGVPVEITDFGKVVSLDEYNGTLVGLTERDKDADIEYVFLGVRGERLVEIEALPITRVDALRIKGMKAIVKELWQGSDVLQGGVHVNLFLFRNAAPGRFRNEKGNIQGSVTLDVIDRNGNPGYVYVYIDEDGVAVPERGWENEIAINAGTPQTRYDVGLEVVPTVTE